MSLWKRPGRISTGNGDPALWDC